MWACTFDRGDWARIAPATSVEAVVTWKKALLVGLVLLLVLLGLPMLMPGMGASFCHECGPAVVAGCANAAVLVSAVLLVALLAAMVRRRRDRWHELLVVTLFERPPRLA
jgi:hypothetical protein